MYVVNSKGKDLSESGKQKPWTPFLLKIQILNREWWSHLPMNEKTLGSHSESLWHFFCFNCSLANGPAIHSPKFEF